MALVIACIPTGISYHKHNAATSGLAVLANQTSASLPYNASYQGQASPNVTSMAAASG